MWSEVEKSSGGEWGRMKGKEAILALAALALLIYTEASYMHVQARVHGFPRKPGNPSDATEALYYSSQVAQRRAKGDLLLHWAL